MPAVWEQYRSVEAGEVSLDGLDLDITVRKPKDDPLEFEVDTWNLTDQTWSRIDDGDLARIELGWVDGQQDTVCIGEIDKRKQSMDSNDLKFTIKGIDESDSATKSRPSSAWSKKSWSNRTPERIVTDIASEIGLTAVVGSTNQSIDGVWSLNEDQKVSEWLDELLDYAVEYTGEDWEWYVTEGQLHFSPRHQQTMEVPSFSYGSSLISLAEGSSTDDDAELEVEFEVMLEPRIRKGVEVYIDDDLYRGAYRVSDYEFRSSTVSGDHLVQGTLIPIEGDYSVS